MNISCRFLTRFVTALAVAAVTFVSCSKDDDFRIDEPTSGTTHTDNMNRGQAITKNLLLVYSAGFNNLSPYLQDDIKELTEGYVPGGYPYDNVLLVFSRRTSDQSGLNWETGTAPVLEKIYKDDLGEVVRDSLDIPGFTSSTMAADVNTLKTVLQYVKDNFAGYNYGMIFSSHATGWLPSGYYANGSSYISMSLRQPVQYLSLPEPVPGMPLTKSIGADFSGKSSAYTSREMEIADFASSIPLHLDYILFDACLMGGIEVAYQLRDVCDKVAFSQAEVLAEGFDYKNMGEKLLKGGTADIEAVCRDFYNFYNSKPSGAGKSATISLVRTDRLKALASCCKTLFDKYRESMSHLGETSVQGYFGGGKHWFYDLEDILVKAGIDSAEKAALDVAISDAIVYKGCTGQFFSSVDNSVHTVNSFCGLSMYLPSCGDSTLDKFYRGLSWNDDSALVK